MWSKNKCVAAASQNGGTASVGGREVASRQTQHAIRQLSDGGREAAWKGGRLLWAIGQFGRTEMMFSCAGPVNGAASDRILSVFVEGRLLDDSDADVLNGIDGLRVRARLKCDACNQTMHWKQEGVIRSKQKLCQARRGETMKAFCISTGDDESYIAQDVVLVEHEQMAQKLFEYEAAQIC